MAQVLLRRLLGCLVVRQAQVAVCVQALRLRAAQSQAWRPLCMKG